MITLTIAGANGTATINDTGTSGYVLAAFDPGTMVRDNAYASSRWLDGASLVSSRSDLASVSVVVQVRGTALAHVQSQIDYLGNVVDAFSYTVTSTYTGGSVVYNAMPASYSVTWDPSLLRANMAMMTLSIPVQP